MKDSIEGLQFEACIPINNLINSICVSFSNIAQVLEKLKHVCKIDSLL